MSAFLIAAWAFTKKAAVFLRAHWYIPLFLVGLLLGWLLSGRRCGLPWAKDPLGSVKTELARA